MPKTIEQLYEDIAPENLQDLHRRFEEFVDEFESAHGLRVGYAKFFLIDDHDEVVCEATYSKRCG